MFEGFTKTYEKKCKLHSNMKVITGTLPEDLCKFFRVSRWIILRMVNVSHKVIEKIKTQVTFSNIFRKSCILWDNVEKWGAARHETDVNTTQSMWSAFR